MWFFNKKKPKEEEVSEVLKAIGGMLKDLEESHTKLLNDQRSLRGLVNRKMGNKLKYEDDEDEPVGGLDPQVKAFCQSNGVNWKENFKEIKANEDFIKNTYEFKAWAEAQS